MKKLLTVILFVALALVLPSCKGFDFLSNLFEKPTERVVPSTPVSAAKSKLPIPAAVSEKEDGLPPPQISQPLCWHLEMQPKGLAIMAASKR